MLEGTDLSSAWGPLLSEEPRQAQAAAHAQQQPMQPPDQEQVRQPSLQYQANELQAQQAQQHQQPQQLSQTSYYGSGDQYEKEQQLMAVINELKRRQQTAQASAQPGYWDKLMAKKKDLVKFFQSALIIIFALAVHFLIQHYFQQYMTSNDISFERELILRLLYPVGIAFIAWNILLIYK